MTLERPIPASAKKSSLNARQLANQNGVPYLREEQIQPYPEALALVPADYARKHQVLPLYRGETYLVVIVADPTDLELVDALSALTRMKTIELAVADADVLRRAINGSYPLAQA